MTMGGGSSLGPRHSALATHCPYQQAFLGLLNSLRMGFRLVEHMTHQLVVGNFSQPGAPVTAGLRTPSHRLLKALP